MHREHFLKAALGGGAVLAVSGNSAAAAPEGQTLAQAGPVTAVTRCERAYAIRRDAANACLTAPRSIEAVNGDEQRYADKRASFSKTLPHNQFGEVDPVAYAALVAAINSGDPQDFERLQRGPKCTTRLNNPQAAYAYDMTAMDSHATRLAPPPAFDSARMAAEMGEVYWQALARDVPFRRYEDHPIIAAAVSDLNHFREPVGDGVGRVSPETIFRGESPGDRVGPYISQFLLQEVPYGIARIEQRYRFPARGQQFLTSNEHWLASQAGQSPKEKIVFDDTHRYIASFRELVEYVHQDFSYQPYLNAALIMLKYGPDAMAASNPYRGYDAQLADITFGNKNILTMLAQAALVGQKAAWYHKWLVHRRLRPEVFAGRIAAELSGARSYGIHPDILHSDAVARTKAQFGSALLPIAYPEGSPTHPSYPAAHAANAGACITVLKAFFNPDFVIPKPVQATADGSALEAWTGAPLTLGNEIDKLAANISMGRDAAGVHYRSDCSRGMLIGEQTAIRLLCDYSLTYNERFDGFAFTKIDGSRVRIANGKVTSS